MRVAFMNAIGRVVPTFLLAAFLVYLTVLGVIDINRMSAATAAALGLPMIVAIFANIILMPAALAAMLRRSLGEDARCITELGYAGNIIYIGYAMAVGLTDGAASFAPFFLCYWLLTTLLERVVEPLLLRVFSDYR